MQVSCVTIDCSDVGRMVAFWSRALGYEVRGSCCHPADGIGPYLEFIAVPEQKTVKNRVHLGFHAHDLDGEIARLTALGASLAWEEEFPPDLPYRNVVLLDPEGNEFCLGTSPVSMVRSIAAAVTAFLDGVDLPEGIGDGLERARHQLGYLKFWPF